MKKIFVVKKGYNCTHCGRQMEFIRTSSHESYRDFVFHCHGEEIVWRLMNEAFNSPKTIFIELERKPLSEGTVH